MKKIFSLLLALALILSLAACGGGEQKPSSNPPEEEPKEPLNLIGNWVQEDADPDSYQAGYISDNRIEVFWITDGGNSSSLYWSGTYDAPTEATETYSWKSKNDTSRTGNALLASGDDEKEFSYSSGKLSYSVSFMGTTKTVALVPTEENYTSLGGAYSEVDASVEKLPVELVNSGYTVYQEGPYTKVSYAVELKNPNEDYAVEFPVIRITSKNADGGILSNDEQTLMAIAAGDTMFYGNVALYEGAAPETVEISVLSGDDDYDFQLQQGSEILYTRDLQVSNISMIDGDHRSFTGEVSNQSKIDLSNYAITVIYKMGDTIVGGTTGYGDALKSGATAPFEIDDYDDFPSESFDGYEIFAIQW